MIRDLAEGYLASWPARLLALAMAVGGVLGLVFWLPYTWPYRIDIDVYRLGGEAFLRGADLYAVLPDTEVGANLPFTYPPIAAALFSGFAVMSLQAASTLISLVSLLCLGWVLLLVIRGTTDRPRAQVWWLTVLALGLTLWLGPVRENIEFGQINPLLMALVMTDLLAGRNKWWRGSLVGLAVAIKLTPAVFLMYFLLRRDWRAMAGTVVSFALYTAIGFALRPGDSITYWTSALGDTDRIGHPGFPSNLSINGFLARLGIDSRLAWFLVAGVAGLAISWVAWRLLKVGEHAAAGLTIGQIALFCSPVSWGHHWVWAVPLVVVLVMWAARGGSLTALWLGLAAVGAWVLWAKPQWWYPSEENARPDWMLLQQLVGSSYLLWAALAMVAIGAFAPRLRRSAAQLASAR